MEEVNGGGATLIKLMCCVKNYDWGRIGHESTVACLYYRNTGININQDQPYAEFWMGTHESGTSYVVGEREKVTLKDWIDRNPCGVLGEVVLNKWGTDFPFLFKVLSVAKALSIQAHPDKDLATSLHKEQPSVYKDDNHKSEMALAVTQFEALCGFLSLEELKVIVRTKPEIVELIGNAKAAHVLNLNEDDGKEEVKLLLRSVFTDIMTVRKDVTTEVLAKLISRLNVDDQGFPEILKGTVVNPIHKEIPPSF